MAHGERYTQPAITHLIETKPVTTVARFIGPLWYETCEQVSQIVDKDVARHNQ